MLNKIIAFSLKNRVFVVAGAILLFILGVFVIMELPVDVLPDLNRPTVTIFLEAEGLAPEEMETLVTFPVETVMNGATGVERVRSVSSVGLGLVFVEFGWGTNIYIDRQIVAEKLQTAKAQLPENVNPVLGPISSIMGEIMLIGLSSENPEITPMDLRTFADWVIRPRLLTVSGVSQVIAIGGDVKQYQVLVKPDKLNALGVTIHDVDDALSQSNVNTSGAFIFEGAKESMVRNLARIQTLDDLKESVIKQKDSVPILLKHVADVRYGPPIKRGDASVNAKPAVVMSIQKQPGANTVKLTKKLEKVLEEIQQTLPQGVRINQEIFKQANFIESAIKNVEEALRDGAIFVTIILFLFLLNFRTTFITLTAIPLSFIVTALIFKSFGLSINTMTLGGLAVAIGELVDDAIVDVENIFRRLKENRHKPNPDPPLKVIFEASSEVRNSIVFATVIVILVFIPLFFMGGIEGRIFTPLGVAYIVSILASLVISLTVTPALSSYLLPNAKFMKKEEDGFLVRFLKGVDRNYILKYTLRHPYVTSLAATALLLISLFMAFFLGREFLPSFNEGSITINVLSPPGTSLQESNRIGTIAENLILSIPEARDTGRRTGRAEMDEHAEGVHSTEIEVELKHSKRSREQILSDLRARLSQIPGVVVNIGQPISHRIDHLLSGIRAQIAVKLFGSDLSILRDKAEEIRRVMSEIPGVVDLYVEQQVLVPQTRIEIDRMKVQKYGLQVGEIAEVLETVLNGKVVSQVLEGIRSFELVVRFPDEARANIKAIENVLIDTPDGQLIPLRTVARVIESMGPNQVYRENAQRRIVIQSNTSGRDLASIITDIQKGIKEHVVLPEGYFVAYGGQFESQQKGMRTIGLLSLVSLAGMFLVLYSHFRSARIVFQILLSIPFALIGAVIGIYLIGGVMSLASLVAFVTLTGITCRNSIMMIAHYLHLMRHEGEKFDEHMIIRGSLERLVPVLMTAATTMLGVIPLILAKGQPGKEILYPLAIVIFSGLFSSTLLDVCVRPAIFWKFGRKATEKIFKEESPDLLSRVFPDQYQESKSTNTTKEKNHES